MNTMKLLTAALAAALLCTAAPAATVLVTDTNGLHASVALTGADVARQLPTVLTTNQDGNLVLGGELNVKTQRNVGTIFMQREQAEIRTPDEADDPSGSLILQTGNTEGSANEPSGNILLTTGSSATGSRGIVSIDAATVAFAGTITGVSLADVLAQNNDANNSIIRHVGAPDDDDDAATKLYVDNAVSDRNRKQNVRPATNFLSRVATLPIYTFNYIPTTNVQVKVERRVVWKTNATTRAAAPVLESKTNRVARVSTDPKPHFGTMAQDWARAFPELDGSGKTINRVDFMGVALGAIQELKQQLDAERTARLELEKRVAELEKRR